MKIALCRLGSPVTSREIALERLAKTYRRAVADKARLVVFPDLKMIAPQTASESPQDVFLRPHDLTRLARATESVPLLLGGALRARQRKLENPDSALAGGVAFFSRASSMELLWGRGMGCLLQPPVRWR